MSCISISRLCSPNSVSLAASPDSSCDSLIVEATNKSNAAAASCMCVTMPSRTTTAAGTSNGSESRSHHLDKHVHLTNCIHLKNRFHVQKHKMMVEARHQQHPAAAAAGLPLMKELTALSRTRSLRDPSTSSILKSPLMKTVPARKLDHPRRDDSRGRGDRSTGSSDSHHRTNKSDWHKGCNAQTVQETTISGDVVHEKRDEDSARAAAVPHNWDQAGINSQNNQVWKDESHIGHVANSVERTPKRYRKPQGSRPDQKGEDENVGKGQHVSNLSRKLVAQLQQQQSLSTTVQGHSPSPLSVYDDPSILGLKYPPAPPRRRSNKNSFESDQEASADEEEEEEEEEERKMNVRSRSQSPLLSRDVSNKSRSPVVSREIVKSRAFSFPDPAHPSSYHYTGGNEEEVEGTEEPKHGCGIPWHWSRLGHKQKGKSFLDIAGRSLSCGYPDASAKRKGGDQVLSRSQSGSGREIVATMFPSDCLSYSSAANSDAEVLPLLTEPEASVSGDVAGSSVEVDSDNVISRECNSRRKSTVSRKGRSHAATEILQARLRERLGWINSMAERRLMHEEGEARQHRSLSHKYRPRSFRDMVGQNVVVQSLSNAVFRGRIVSVYLFQGPRGTGKSSAARVFAAALNCLSSEELRPCGLCRECVALNLGKSMDVREFDASRLGRLDSVKQLLESVMMPPSSARYRVSIVDECHMLSAESWNLFFKALEEPPGHSILILITSSPEQLPRILVSRCQKFPFTKIKDADIINRLQKIATKENIDVEIEALELIASRSNGSLRDAETTLDQLGLLGQVVTLSTVQELIGLLPDDKLMEFLDFAISGDTVSTVRSVRDLLDSGVEPLALMSQLATLITDILAGTYKPAVDQHKRRRFFHKNTLNKEDLERLRRALKILSEAEKQVRASNDQTTWLTAAVLQFAPDRTYVFPSSSTGTSATQSLVGGTNDTSEKETGESESGGTKQGWEHDHEHFDTQANDTAVFARPEVATEASHWAPNKSLSTVPEARIHPYIQSSYTQGDEDFSFDRKRLDDVWLKVLRGSRSKSLKHLLRAYGKLVSLSMQEVHAAVEIEFQHPEHKTKAEKFKTRISHGFQLALGCPVEVHFNVASKMQPHCGDSLHSRQKTIKGTKSKGESSPTEQATQLAASDQLAIRSKGKQNPSEIGFKNEERLESAWAREAQNMPSAVASLDPYHSEKLWNFGDAMDPNNVPLGIVTQQGAQGNAESYSQDLQYDLTGPLKFRRVRHLGPEVIISSDTALEHANLRLESRTKSNRRLLCCWRAPRTDEEKKAKQRKRRRRRACFFLRLVPCARACTR